jgi:hypothetical protein
LGTLAEAAGTLLKLRVTIAAAPAEAITAPAVSLLNVCLIKL